MPAIPYHAYNRCLLNLAEEEKCRGLPVASSLRAHLSKLTVATWVLLKASGCSIPQFLEREVYVRLFFQYISYAAKLRFMLVELIENTIIRIFVKNAISIDSICVSLTHQSHTAVIMVAQWSYKDVRPPENIFVLNSGYESLKLEIWRK